MPHAHTHIRTEYESGCQKAGCKPIETLSRYLDTLKDDKHLLFFKLNGNHPARFKDRVVDSQLGGIAETFCNDRLKGLDLSYNNLTDACAPAIAKIIAGNPHLRTLILTSNDLTAAGIAVIVKALVSPVHGLQTLKLGCNPLGNDGAEHLCELLRASKALKDLDVGNVGLSERGLIQLAATLHDHNDRLEVLNLERPCFKFPQNDAINHIARMVSTQKHLRELHVGKMDLDDHQFDILVTHGLLLNRSVTKIDLRANRLTGFSGPAFERLLAARPIVTLNLASNALGDSGAEALAACMRASKSLLHLDLRSNQILDTGLAALAKAVVAAPQLQQMLVWGNAFGNKGSAAFAKSIADMHAGGAGVCAVDIRPYTVDGRAYVALLDVPAHA